MLVDAVHLRLRTLPGEEAQCDWAHLGYLQVGRARRPLMAFLMVLSYSRRIYLRFFLNARMESFLRGHVEAFAAFGGALRHFRKAPPARLNLKANSTFLMIFMVLSCRGC